MKRKKTIFVIESLLGLLILVTACHKEDISTLYSRQYQLSAEITGINAEILRINNEIVELKISIPFWQTNLPLPDLTTEL